MKKIIFVVLAVVFSTTMILESCSSDSISVTDEALEFRGGHGNGNGNGNIGNNSGNANQANLCTCIESNYPNEELSESEKTALIKMREEEKLARDVYIAM